jgi:cell division topological specificity factor
MSIPVHLTKFLNYFQRSKKTAHVAKERLQIIIAHERIARDKPDYLSSLQKELLDVITRYVAVDPNDIKIELARKEGCSILELNVTLPNLSEQLA